MSDLSTGAHNDFKLNKSEDLFLVIEHHQVPYHRCRLLSEEAVAIHAHTLNDFSVFWVH